MQVAQQVFVVKEWVCDTHNEANTEAVSHVDVEKSSGALKQAKAKLSTKLKAADQARLSAEVSLKIVERQAKDQCQKLHLTKINLATQRQLVIDLKGQLQKAKEAVQLVKEVAKAEKQACYMLSVDETQARLTEEFTEVCKDYCSATWDRDLGCV